MTPIAILALSGSPHQKVLEEQRDTMGRWVTWQPAVVELYDNRLMPLASRENRFTIRLPDAFQQLRFTARVRYET